MEDVDIPNPNHFAENGTTGGPVGMLNNNLLVNSDFITSAFPAEYGNALSGVFDLKMRNGNNEKHEYLFQSGFNGFEIGAEGPFNKKHKSSYLANFRYSTLELVDNIIDIGTSGVPKYTDFSFKMNFPLTKGRITVFGLAGNSEIAMLDSKKDEQDLYTDEGQDLYNYSKMGTTGISYAHYLSSKTYIKFNVTGLYQTGGSKIDTLDINKTPHRQINHQYGEFKTSAGMLISSKINTHLTVKSGIYADKMGYDLNTKRFNTEDQDFRQLIDENRTLRNGLWLIRGYSQASIKVNNRLNINPGLHILYFDQSADVSVEPRIGVSYNLTERQRINVGYGYHSKIQSLATYFISSRKPNGSYYQTNTDLGLTKSNQFVLGYDASITDNTRIKLETYYQNLFNVPVERESSSFSLLNMGAGWGPNTSDSLVNKGTGKNYGIEVTLERFFSRNIYYLVTVSLYESKYKGSDGIERNTAFNGNYVINTLLGKEFTINERSAFTIDYKLTWAGGKRYTPIDIEKSRYDQETVYQDDQAFSKQFSPFFKTDIKFGYRLNGKKTSQEWQFLLLRTLPIIRMF
ncbi:MAG: TonB-dependent receptor [Bacteroidales bacterium]|nr:TonB-dependent receptor [Bacteroidales bacterium]